MKNKVILSDEQQFETEIKRIEKSGQVMSATVDAMEEISSSNLAVSATDVKNSCRILSKNLVETGELFKKICETGTEMWWDFNSTFESITGAFAEMDRLKTIRKRSKHRGNKAKVNLKYYRESQLKARKNYGNRN